MATQTHNTPNPFRLEKLITDKQQLIEKTMGMLIDLEEQDYPSNKRVITYLQQLVLVDSNQLQEMIKESEAL